MGAFNSMRDSFPLDEMRGMLYNLQMFFSPQQSCIHVVEHIKIDQPKVVMMAARKPNITENLCSLESKHLLCHIHFLVRMGYNIFIKPALVCNSWSETSKEVRLCMRLYVQEICMHGKATVSRKLDG